MDEDKCFFDCRFGCKDRSERLIVAGAVRIRNIIRHSKIYGDNVHLSLQERLENDNELTFSCHKSCVSTYTSSHEVNLHQKRKRANTTSSYIPPKTRRLSLIDSKTFHFKVHCLFCGEKCDIEKDKKNPSRWRPAYPFRAIKAKDGTATTKETILATCEARNDEWAEQVGIRIEGAISDLHAADARYHVDCRNRFLSPANVSCAAGHGSEDGEADPALQQVIDMMERNRQQIWNSVDLYNVYAENGGRLQSRKTLLKKLCEVFGNDLIRLHAEGFANIICFRSQAAESLRLVDDEDDDLDIMLNKTAKRVVSEIKEITLDKKHYSATINAEKLIEATSATLMTLLGTLSPKLKGTFPAMLIGSIVTGVIKNHPTVLQTTLGVKLGRSKKLINTMKSFGVTCSYDEILRFRRSAAQAATNQRSNTGIVDATTGLVQVVADNFDADISSPNGKVSTHSLAVLVTQPESGIETDTCVPETIRRISKEEMTEPVEYDIEIQRYSGPKKPKMPESAAVKTVLPLKLLAQRVVSKRRAEEADFAFVQDVCQKSDCQEYNGYNVSVTREQGQLPMPKTKTTYLPLIDLVPSHPDTIMTAMAEALELTQRTGQEFALITCDLQLHKVALDVKWAYPDRFSKVIPRLGGMHSLMSFVGSIGTLMENSGLADILKNVFGGVDKMLTGKKFPQNVRALRMLAEVILQSPLDEHALSSKGELDKVLEDLAGRSKTSKLWVDMLIKPVFIMMMFVRAEREGDWPLHLEAFEEMIPYFFASGHVHYARYSLCYLRSMEALPEPVRTRFMKGEHVMRHQRGIWNGIWSDMFIETTFMRYGHAPGGIIGITLKPETLKVWALSLYACSRLEADLDDMLDNSSEQTVDRHREEGKTRITSDKHARESLMDKLKNCIDPLDPETHPDEIVNIVTGEHGTSEVNVEDAVKIGVAQMKEFAQKLPDGLHDVISKKVITMVATKKHVSVGDTKLYDTNTIYSRVIGLQASGRDVDIKDVLSYELAPVPTSMFEETGDMRTATSKSSLKHQLQVEVSARTASDVKVSVIDGSALLWVIPWPAEGTVQDYAMNLKKSIIRRLKEGDVFLIFDRYYEYSTKSVTRSARNTGASRVHQLQLNNKLPSQKITLTVTENKKQLIALVVKLLIDDHESLAEHTSKHKLVLFGEVAVPVEISNGGVVIQRMELATIHEEADNIIVQMAMKCAKSNEQSHVTVVSDDTDVFVLLVHYYHLMNLENHVFMESPIKDRTIIDIQKTVQKHACIVAEILPVHAISGCDTVACSFGIGKGTVLKVLRTGSHSLSLLGVVDAPVENVVAQATAFVSACYGHNATSMSETRWKVWASRTGRASATPPKLCSLPPTTEAFVENVKRAHHQAIVWRSLEESNPPELDPELFGWTKDEKRKTLRPTYLPDNTELAPEYIMRLIKCGCKSATPCSTRACSCTSDKLKCTIFCACYCRGCCQNKAD